jgi:glycosyltransferase involved in cell wall biosynthesis
MTGPRMHVLHVYKDVYPTITGGIERHIDDLRRALPDVRSDVLVCSRSRSTTEIETPHGTEIRVAEFGRILSAPIAPLFPFALRRRGADLIHVHMPNPTGEASALLARREIPLVASHHADIVRQNALRPLYAPLVNRLLRRAGAIVVGAHATARQSEFLAHHREKIRVIPYGVDTDRFDAERVDPERVAAIRDDLGSPLVAATGRLVYYKGFDVLIDAAREMDASVVIIGGGPLEAELRAKAAPHPRITITGPVSEQRLVELLAAADCFVLPSTSRAESFGIATVEAQAMGLPAIVTDVGTGTTEAIEPGTTGLVIRPRDVEALRAAIELLLGDDDQRIRMGAAARERASTSLSLTAMAESFRSLYAEILTFGTHGE